MRGNNAGANRKTRAARRAADTDFAGGPSKSVARKIEETLPRSVGELQTWLWEELKVRVPAKAMLAGNSAPLEYLVHTFFEGHEKPRHVGALTPADCVVWASRGGGKTFLGAIATVLDLVFKPGIQIRILGGSIEQSARMYAHLRRFFGPEFKRLEKLVQGRALRNGFSLSNGSRVEIMAQSHTSVRGVHVHKLRCDEVDLFKPGILEAAQLTTRSGRLGTFHVRGAVECLSTMHIPQGVMYGLVNQCRDGGRKLFKWGVLDALEKCGVEHRCDGEVGSGKSQDKPVASGEWPVAEGGGGEGGRTLSLHVVEQPVEGPCPLWEECRGEAKEKPESDAGHVRVDDAIAMKRRVSVAAWRSEMLCERPSKSDAVFPEFDPALHVVDAFPWEADDPGIRWIAGMDFGIRAPTVVLWAALDVTNAIWVVEERVERGVKLKDHIEAIKRGIGNPPWPKCLWIGVDPAGRSREMQTGQSNVGAMRNAGLSVRANWGKLGPGLEFIRARLSPAAGGEPRLKIVKNCPHLIESLARLHYQPSRPLDLTPVKGQHDHAVDALRYMVQNVDGRVVVGRVAY